MGKKLVPSKKTLKQIVTNFRGFPRLWIEFNIWYYEQHAGLYRNYRILTPSQLALVRPYGSTPELRALYRYNMRSLYHRIAYFRYIEAQLDIQEARASYRFVGQTQLRLQSRLDGYQSEFERRERLMHLYNPIPPRLDLRSLHLRQIMQAVNYYMLRFRRTTFGGILMANLDFLVTWYFRYWVITTLASALGYYDKLISLKEDIINLIKYLIDQGLSVPFPSRTPAETPRDSIDPEDIGQAPTQESDHTEDEKTEEEKEINLEEEDNEDVSDSEEPTSFHSTVRSMFGHVFRPGRHTTDPNSRFSPTPSEEQDPKDQAKDDSDSKSSSSSDSNSKSSNKEVEPKEKTTDEMESEEQDPKDQVKDDSDSKSSSSSDSNSKSSNKKVDPKEKTTDEMESEMDKQRKLNEQAARNSAQSNTSFTNEPRRVHTETQETDEDESTDFSTVQSQTATKKNKKKD